MMILPTTPTIDAYIPKLGLIPADRISYVTGAYFILKELSVKLSSIYSKDWPDQTMDEHALVALEKSSARNPEGNCRHRSEPTTI